MKALANRYSCWPALPLAFSLILFVLTACTMNSLPRNMPLTTFDPHRPNFTCKHEADASPPITPEADDLFRQGMAATSFELIWPKDTRDYAKAAQLWQQAADRGHWKAALNLAGLYEQGKGVPWDSEKAVQIVEALMKQGVPAAFDKMGTYHLKGIGVKGSTDRAYAFWQLAADMGSASAQTYLGEKLDATYDNPNMGFWGNKEVGIKMLECSYAQGNGNGAEALGRSLNIGKKHARSLQVFHDGVKFGSEDCASELFVSFLRPDPLTNNMIDKSRADLYDVLSNALELNPDLRFPNLDKVLPLPPAPLPMWDGKPETLIDAAKGIVAVPDVPPTPGSQRTGRAHIPPEHVLQMPTSPALAGLSHYALDIGTAVPYAGYWVPRVKPQHAYRDHEHAWMNAQVPHRYERGERFEPVDLSSMGIYAKTASRIVWRYAGQAIPVPKEVEPEVAQGIARASRLPTKPQLVCRGHKPCPSTGIWFGHVPKEHPMARRFNRWDRQTYLQAGQSFPDPAAMGLPEIAMGDVRWLWCDNANQTQASDLASVTLTDLNGVNGVNGVNGESWT